MVAAICLLAVNACLVYVCRNLSDCTMYCLNNSNCNIYVEISMEFCLLQKFYAKSV